LKPFRILSAALVAEVVLSASILFACTGETIAADGFSETALSDLRLDECKVGWGSPVADAEATGAPLKVGDRRFDTGVGVHAPSAWTLPLDGKADEFRAFVGVQDGNPGSVEFVVKGDDKVLYRSGVMRQGDAAKEVRVPLAGVSKLVLEVTDGGDGNTSDHADWLDAVIVHHGSLLPFLPKPEFDADIPGVPPNRPAQVDWDANKRTFRLIYGGRPILDGKVEGPDIRLSESSRIRRGVEQRITLSAKGLKLAATSSGSSELIAAETRGEAQKSFPLVRTSHGVSDNARNNALYERRSDWELEVLAPAARIHPKADGKNTRTYALEASGDTVTLVFRPHYYQKHKGITFFEPWTYKVREDSITGWCSWFIHFREVTQKDCDELLAVWKAKRFADFGYRFVQLDDGFQSDLEKGRGVAQIHGANSGYPAHGPTTWLDWRKDHFPQGMSGFASACKEAGYEPGIWIGSHFTGKEIIEQHPDWFIRDAKGKPFVAPWASCGVDATNKEAMDTLVRPTFAGVRKAGIPYVKIDLLRHYLYDNLHHNRDFCKSRGVPPEQMFRKYLGAVREELGRDTFILSCWGVLPESVGLADACRIAGDGYGPVSMQQYNSWNGIVWRNDPDACDVYPKFRPAEQGNVTKFEKVVPTNNDTIIRPALASISGSMLLLSDKPDVYRDDRNIEGLRRSSPIVFSVPGQLYDFDDRHSSTVATMKRESITSGTNPAPCDADQFGAICPWWLNEFDFPGVGHWNVLHRLNWGGAAPQAKVAFADLGLESDRDYLVYEFWTGTFLGTRRGTLELPKAEAKELRSYALRPLENHPQIVSTNRHLSQGGADLLEVKWDNGVLSGRSKVVQGDRYELAIHLPTGFSPEGAQFNGAAATVKTEGDLTRISFMPEKSGEAAWVVKF
jgi:hypothetical protein